MTYKKYHTVGTVPKSNLKIVDIWAKSIPLTHIISFFNTVK